MEFCVKSAKGTSFTIKMKQTDFVWDDDKITMFQIGKFSANFENYVVDEIPDFLLSALDDNNRRNAAIKAIGDFIAGWSFRNGK